MKKITLLGLVVLLLLAAIAFHHMRQRAVEQARLVEAERRLAESDAEAARAQAIQERERARLMELNSQLADKARATARTRPAPAAATPPAVSAAGDERSR